MKKESYELWEIAPRYDQRTLRERYVTGDLFNIGDIVENLNTGLIGKIMRRGTNYLICVTEQDNMFKSWIRDVMEYTEKTMERRMRVPGKPNTLEGTGGYLKNAMAATGTSSIKNFINKYKIKKVIELPCLMEFGKNPLNDISKVYLEQIVEKKKTILILNLT